MVTEANKVSCLEEIKAKFKVYRGTRIRNIRTNEQKVKTTESLNTATTFNGFSVAISVVLLVPVDGLVVAVQHLPQRLAQVNQTWHEDLRLDALHHNRKQQYINLTVDKKRSFSGSSQLKINK